VRALGERTSCVEACPDTADAKNPAALSHQPGFLMVGMR
jgi:hypothetical protein